MQIFNRKIYLTLILLSCLSLFCARYYVKTDGSDYADGLSWNTAFQTIAHAVDEADYEGGEIWIASGEYVSYSGFLDIGSGISLYGGFGGTESELSERTPLSGRSIISGKNYYSSFENYGLVDGFVLNNWGKENSRGINNYRAIVNCIICNNTSDDTELIYNSGRMEHCTITGNTSASCAVIRNSGSIINSIIYNPDALWQINDCNRTGQISYSCFPGAVTDNGNIDENPMFLDFPEASLAYDYLLASNSPCVDSGSADLAVLYDIVGTQRSQGALPDMGAYEYSQKLFSDFEAEKTAVASGMSIQFYDRTYGNPTSWQWDFNNDGIIDSTLQNPKYTYADSGYYTVALTVANSVSNASITREQYVHVGRVFYVKPDGSDESDGLSWENSFQTIGKAMEQVDSSDSVWVTCGVYSEIPEALQPMIGVPENVYVYGGFSGSETNISERCAGDHKTIIDGQNKYECVNNYGTFDGFYITRGDLSISNHGFVSSCVITSNASLVYPAVYNYGEVTHCTIYGNNGRGISNYEDGRIYNTIAWDNIGGDISSYSSDAVFNSCYSEALNENGNISEGPMVFNPIGNSDFRDLRLQAESPCIDAGSSDNSCDFDIAGVARPQLFAPDMGAYEFTLDLSSDFYVKQNYAQAGQSIQFYDSSYGDPISWAWDLDGDGTVDSTIQNPAFVYNAQGKYSVSLTVSNGIESKTITKDAYISIGRIYYIKTDGLDSASGTSWNDAFQTIEFALSQSEPGDIFWVANGTYEEPLLTINYGVALYGGFAGSENALEERADFQNRTVIFANDRNNGIINYGILDGCYVTGDKFSQCAVRNYGQIANCVVGHLRNYNGSGITNTGYISHSIIYDVISDYGTGLKNAGYVENSIIWGNYPSDIDSSPSGVEVNCCFQEASTENGNINRDPLFLHVNGDIKHWNFRLQGNSPCINAGNICTVDQQDLAGIMRSHGGKPDIGLFEYTSALSVDFYADKNYGPPGLQVHFFDTSYGNPSQWFWDLNGDGITDSTIQNPTYSYLQPGAYTVSLIISDGNEQSIAIRKEFVQIGYQYYVKKEGSDSASGLSWTDAFASITAATELSQPGDLIWVAKGIYSVEDTAVIPEEVSLYGGFSGTEQYANERNIEENCVIINGPEYNNHCVENYGFLDGVEVTGGKSSGVYGYPDSITQNCKIYHNVGNSGGGVYLKNAVIRNCTVFGNHADSNGGGIYATGYISRIENCHVYSNYAGYYGGGIYCNSGSVIDSYVGKNISSARGGGVYLDDSFLERCIISDNSSSEGGGIYAYTSQLKNNLIYSNSARGDVGGIYAKESSFSTISMLVQNCTIYGNETEGDCGGILSEGKIQNTISWGNQGMDIKLEDEGSVAHSCYKEASANSDSLSVNPVLLNPHTMNYSQDFRLSPDSPCKDLGLSQDLSDYDLDGNKRLQGTAVDMGAYEIPENLSAHFYADKTRGSAGLTVQFTNASYGNSTGYAWDFDDDGIIDSTIENPTYSYQSPGKYTVKLTVSEGTNTSESIMNDYIMISRVYYVSSEGNDENDGLSWDACMDLTSALDKTIFGDEVKAKSGLYSVNSTVIVPDGVALKGGYSGVYDQIARAGISEINGQELMRCVVNYGLLERFYLTHGNGNYGSAIQNFGTCSTCVCNNNDGTPIYNYGKVAHVTSLSRCSTYVTYPFRNYGFAANSIFWDLNGGSIRSSSSAIEKNCCYPYALNENGNISTSPKFLNTDYEPNAWDFQLRASSDCINSGTNEFAENIDMQGRARPINGTVDIGAYEWTSDLSANFYVEQRYVRPGEAFYFVDTSYGIPISWSWDFDSDGIVDSTDQNPTYTYSEPGTYTITLTVSNAIGSDAVTFTDFIRVGLTYYVQASGSDSNDGLSWETAFASLPYALSKVLPGDMIAISKGEYSLAEELVIPANVSVYGGYSGLNNNLENPSPKQNPVVLLPTHNDRMLFNQGVVSGLSFSGWNNNEGTFIKNEGTMKKCRIFKNFSEKGYSIYNATDAIIECCEIFSNSHCSVSNSGFIANCLLYDNLTSPYSFISIGEKGLILHSTIYHNTGALYGVNGSGRIRNSIIWRSGLQDVVAKNAFCCCFAQGQEGNVYGNVTGNPLFENTAGDVSTWDLHLRNGSPCIDRGDVGYSTDYDFEGNARSVDDQFVCMGAYESIPSYEPQYSVPRKMYVSALGDFANGSSWENAFSSISEAVNVANSIDDESEIWVTAGLYQDDDQITIPARVTLYGGFYGNETQLDQRDFSLNKSEIHGRDQHRCVTNGGTLDGFKITHGYLDWSGAGAVNYGVLRNCEIAYNEAVGQNVFGGGIYNLGSVENCLVHDNRAQYGGGIADFTGEINYCDIFENTADYGGGFFADYSMTMDDIHNCRFYRNEASLYGGAIYTMTRRSFTNCLIYDNHSDSFRGSFSCQSYGYSTYTSFINCTIVNNSSVRSGGSMSGNLLNTIYWGNDSGYSYWEGDLTYSCIEGYLSGDGNISGNPGFVNVQGDSSTWDLHLKKDSICIDRGTASDAPLFDFEGIERPQGEGFDIGASEYILKTMVTESAWSVYE